jgi:excinuclease ABC subunit A
VSVSIPKNKLTVVTGVSGSGKSSLAFDTLYAEGQKRYLESLSIYARMIIAGGHEETMVDEIRGLSPTISINQKTVSSNPRSTVGTITEIYDFYRLLFLHVGVQQCPIHGTPLQKNTIGEIFNGIKKLPVGERFFVCAPIIFPK